MDLLRDVTATQDRAWKRSQLAREGCLAHIARRVGVEPEEVATAFEQLALLTRKLGQPLSADVAHLLWIVTQVHRVSKPPQVEGEHVALRCLVGGIAGIHWLVPLRVQSQGDLPRRSLDNFGTCATFPKDAHRLSVRQEHVVGCQVGLRSRELSLSWRVDAECVTEDALRPGLVNRNPPAHVLAQIPETQVGVVGEVAHDVAAQPAAPQL
mmetsp:Transcript_43025/g.111129  ORF Transcript_43025/g.111129 Transcript_43025/m.111129 type:complete len:210 (-) Transcript_43025:211-840(-)